MSTPTRALREHPGVPRDRPVSVLHELLGLYTKMLFEKGLR
jgi:hypothetical protein